ncbi:polysaccharide biosynthesis/export family protein [Erythrobacter crassostreae]|uniref:Polysaccharide export protein n=1 Tax=Erythrobacter crassostreae TaxID=2828328 RepID=A0A9X1F1N9_9SPHN|nr:polysaccharide biosynthesis/export family protein [Erythrobacter crassostrea]MBV7258509.1 polysaccharide export protein [Erythrobacter crassostrea]
MMRLPTIQILALSLAIALGGCATVDRTYGAAPDVEIADLTELPAPGVGQVYRLGGQEVVEIAVVGAEALSGTYLTDEAGDIVYPFLGKVKVAGLSPNEAAAVIADGLRGDYLLDPQVRLIPASLPEDTLSVGGQVKEPGSFPASGKMTLLRAVNEAGGLADYARHDEVIIMRTVDGQSYIGLYDIGAIERGNYADPLVYADDVIMVGDSPGRRRIDRLIELASPVLTTAAIVLNQLSR